MNVVFEQYFQDLAEEAIGVFRTFRKEDIMDDVLDPEFDLISEAFDDVDTLLNYSTVIGKNNNISMEECGFIASHINSIENKYKGLVNFNTIVAESQEPDYRATVVSEALGKGAIGIILGLIAAILGFIFMWKKKDKTELTAVSEADLKESDALLERLDEIHKFNMDRIKKWAEEDSAKKELREAKRFSFTSHSKFLEHYFTKNASHNDNDFLKEEDYRQAYKNFESRLVLVLEVFEISKAATLLVTDTIKAFIKAVRKNGTSGKKQAEKALDNLDRHMDSKATKAYELVKGYEFITYSEIKPNELLLGFNIKLNSSKLFTSKGPYACIFSEIKTIKDFHSLCVKNENDKTLPWSTSSLKNGDTTGIGFYGSDVSDLEKLINDIDTNSVKLDDEFKAYAIKTAKDLISAFGTMTRQTLGLTLAFRKEQNYAANFVKELAKQSTLRIEAIAIADKAKNGKISDDKTIGE